MLPSTCRSSHQRCYGRNGVLGNFCKILRKIPVPDYLFNKVAGLRPQACNFIKKEALAQVFSCEFCKIVQNTFFTEHILATASAHVMCTCNELTIISYFGKCEYDYCFNMLQECDTNIFKEC